MGRLGLPRCAHLSTSPGFAFGGFSASQQGGPGSSLTGPDATFVSTGIAFVEYLIGAIGVSVVMTWVFNNTGSSVLMAILFHTAIDVAFAFAVLFPTSKTDLSPSSFGTLGIAIVFSIAALVIIVATRGQLSYQRYQREVELPATSGTVR